MVYVYLIESIPHRQAHYVGVTRELRKRLADHNEGKSLHTAKFRPWVLVIYIGFADEVEARNFEKYLKSGSGRTFLKRHFLKPAHPMTPPPRHRV